MGNECYTDPIPTNTHTATSSPLCPPNYCLFPDAPYFRQTDKVGLSTPCLMEALISFIPSPSSHSTFPFLPSALMKPLTAIAPTTYL